MSVASFFFLAAAVWHGQVQMQMITTTFFVVVVMDTRLGTGENCSVAMFWLQLLVMDGGKYKCVWQLFSCGSLAWTGTNGNGHDNSFCHEC